MNSSLKEQLVKIVPSLGLAVESSKRKVSPKYIGRNQIIINLAEDLAEDGKRGKKRKVPLNTDILGFFNFLEKEVKDGRISVVNKFFCLYAIENIVEFHIATQKKFHDQLCLSATEIIKLAKMNPIGLNKADQETFKINSNIIEGESAELKLFVSLARNILKFGIDVDPTISRTPELNAKDCELSLLWHKNNLPIQANRDTLKNNFGKDYHIGRLLSARAAEKAMTSFYIKCHYKVEDIAITQLEKNNNSDWQFYDLKVDNKPIDVKNARRSLSNNNYYVEHCIRGVKATKDGLQVTIAGVLSQYLWVETLLDQDDSQRETSLIVLGETTYDKHEILKGLFESSYFKIDFSRPAQGGNFFLPAWIFDYPKDLYKRRDEAIEELFKKIFPDFGLCDYCKFNPIPLSIAVGIDIAAYWPEEALRKWEWDFYKDLFSRVRSHGLSLPILYLSILSHFINMVYTSSSEHGSYSPKMYQRFIFEKGAQAKKNPLGIHDPLGTIDALIGTLDILWLGPDSNKIRDYRYFKLSGFNILLGKENIQDKWKTLVAYCGGRREVNGSFIKCGEYPLVLGKSKHCKECGKLICPKCNFCSLACE